MSEERQLAKASEEQLKAYCTEQNARWAEAAGMFTRLDQLKCSSGEGSLADKGDK